MTQLTIPFLDLKPHPILKGMGWCLDNVHIPPQGGRTTKFLENWRLISNDPFLLEAVSGYNLEFAEIPYQTTQPHALRFSAIEREALNNEVERLLELQVLQDINQKEVRFLCHPFLREKRDGGHRMIVNLKPLNRFVQYHHFKMETLQTLRSLIQENDYMVKIDLKDAFLSIPLSKEASRYVAFKWGDRTLCMRALPFGLGSSPRTFTKVTKPILALLRKLGMRLMIFLDDLILLNQDKVMLEMERDSTIYLLTVLGFTVNWSKSQLIPAQTMGYLGLTVSTIGMSLSLPEEKVTKIIEKCRSVISARSLKVRNLAKLIGQLTASAAAVLPAPLHYRYLQKLKAQSLRLHNQRYEAKVELSQQAREEVDWWMTNLSLYNGRSVRISDPDLIITSDASMSGWGAVAGGTKIQGLWSPLEKQSHINLLELRAASLAVRTFSKDIQPRHIHLRMDNMTAVAHVNKMGGTKSDDLIEGAKELWEFCLTNKITHMSAEHLPGLQNQVADEQSRVYKDSSHWKLETSTFQQVVRLLGPVTIDLFADRVNTQMEKYVSWRPDPFAMATDAFSLKWNQEIYYIFPPFCLVSRVMQKIQKDQTTAILIAPTWNTQPWYPQILESLVELPILLPQTPTLLSSPILPVHPLLQTGSLHLAAWKVSGVRSLRQNFLRKQPNSCNNHGDQVHKGLILCRGQNSVAGVTGGKLILFQPLWKL